jgi:hypothetical protein
MDIVKAFNANDLHTEVVIKRTKTDPLFRASDIGIILEINNIRMSIIDFDESEKRAVSSTDSTGRMQYVTFLTEKGFNNSYIKLKRFILFNRDIATSHRVTLHQCALFNLSIPSTRSPEEHT